MIASVPLTQEHWSPFAEGELVAVSAGRLPALKSIDAVAGFEDLVNPRGFILIDQHHRNPKYKNIYWSASALPFFRSRQRRCRPARVSSLVARRTGGDMKSALTNLTDVPSRFLDVADRLRYAGNHSSW